MMHRFVRLSTSLLLATGAASPLSAAPTDDPSTHHHSIDDCEPCGASGCGKALMFRKRAEAGLMPFDGRDEILNSFSDREALGDTDVLNNNLDIALDPVAGTISGSNTITIKSLVPSLTQFTFALRSNFNVSNVQVNGANVALPSGPGANSYLRTVTLDRPYVLDEEFTVKITYSGVPVSRGFGSIEFTSQNGIPLISSLSQPYYAATWWPAKDGDVFQPGDNADKATWTCALTTPGNLMGVSNGSLLSVDDLPDGRKRWNWQSNYQMSTYLASISATNYNQYSVPYTWNPPGGGTPVSFPFRYFMYPGSDTAGNRGSWEKVLPMMDVLQPVYGVYPFADEGYGMYQFPFGGGMEHQTMTGQDGYTESLTVHELGHQWWGDNVTCRTWHDIWFNEGMATYTEALWSERKPGSTGLPALISAMNARKPSAAVVGGTVYVYDTSDLNAIFDPSLSYDKAAWVWHMLRGIVGDQTFWNILAQFRTQYTGSAVTTADIEALAEAVSGKDLTAFFSEWVYNGGAPTYVRGFQNLTVNGKTYAKFHIRQSQSFTPFTTPIDAAFTVGAGVTTHKVQTPARTSWFVRANPGLASVLNLDPGNWVLNYGKTTETYQAGPPVVLEGAPAPGAAPEFRVSPTNIKVTFSENVNLSAANFQVFRTGGAPVTFSYSWNLATLTATLQFDSRLSPSQYNVQVVGSPSSVATGQLLDGDVANPLSASSLPSGNGLAGGNASYLFDVVAGPCPADMNNDNMVDDADFVIFAGAYDLLLSMGGDINGDALTDDVDFVLFASAYDILICP